MESLWHILGQKSSSDLQLYCVLFCLINKFVVNTRIDFEDKSNKYGQ